MAKSPNFSRSEYNYILSHFLGKSTEKRRKLIDGIHFTSFCTLQPITGWIAVGISCFQSMLIGIGGSQRTTGFLSGNTAVRGPVQ